MALSDDTALLYVNVDDPVVAGHFNVMADRCSDAIKRSPSLNE